MERDSRNPVFSDGYRPLVTIINEWKCVEFGDFSTDTKYEYNAMLLLTIVNGIRVELCNNS